MKIGDLAGNHRLVELLSRGHLPPASLFSGPSGVGKKTLALLLAARANCHRPVPGDLCGECPSCFRAAQGTHPDILLFTPEKGAIKIDRMRLLRREARYRPLEGRRRFFIVDGAERMTAEAANCLLKTLEEPAETSALVLLTPFPEQLLDTIRSRCQRFTFRPLAQQELVDSLRSLGVEDAPERAAFAQGSLGRALSLDLAGLRADQALALELLSSWCEERSFESIFLRCEEPRLRAELRKRERALAYLEQLQVLLEELYFVRIGTPERVVHRGHLERLKSMRVSLHWIDRFLYHVERTRWDIEHYVNPLMAFETLWLMDRSGEVAC